MGPVEARSGASAISQRSATQLYLSTEFAASRGRSEQMMLTSFSGRVGARTHPRPPSASWNELLAVGMNRVTGARA